MKKKHPEHVNLERWLVSYADFITLLFAFFVVMYAMANQDKAKVKQITEAIERTFRGPSMMLDVGSGKEVNVMSNPSGERGQVIDTMIGRTNARPDNDPELQKIAQRVEDNIAYQLQTTDLKDKLEIVYDDRGLVIRFSANKLFLPGQENVDKNFLPLVDSIAETLKNGDRIIRIEGHTDNQPPANTEKFPSNWELSTGRAAWIVRYFRAKFDFPAPRLSAAGYADAHPIATNDNEEGRAVNRRVEFVVTNLKYMPKK